MKTERRDFAAFQLRPIIQYNDERKDRKRERKKKERKKVRRGSEGQKSQSMDDARGKLRWNFAKRFTVR